MHSQQPRPMPTHHAGEVIYRNQFCKEHHRDHLAMGGEALRFKPTRKMESPCDVDSCENPVAFKEKSMTVSRDTDETRTE